MKPTHGFLASGKDKQEGLVRRQTLINIISERPGKHDLKCVSARARARMHTSTHVCVYIKKNRSLSKEKNCFRIKGFWLFFGKSLPVP